MINQNNGANSLFDFFDNLASFDTETTGVSNDSQIWQSGFTNKGIDAEHVVNPFYRLDNKLNSLVPEKLSIKEFQDRIINMNGDFSRDAHVRGDFDLLMQQHTNLIKNTGDKLSLSLSDTIKNTLGHLNMSDILVLQNHNFENKLLQRGFEDKLLSNSVYTDIMSKMEYLGLNETSGNVSSLLQTPPRVLENMREATKHYQLKYIKGTGNKEAAFNSYVKSLNSAMDEYKVEFSKPRRRTIVVEQMDITKALFANAAQQGYLDKLHTDIGLNMNFLTNIFSDVDEKHTALSDSKDTVKAFKETWTMLEELRSNKVSAKTITILDKINVAQTREIHSRFLKSVSSVLSDFSTRGYTKYGPSGSFHLAPTSAYNSQTGEVIRVKPVSIGSNKGVFTDMEEALRNIKSRYKDYGGATFREEHLTKVKETFNSGGLQDAIDYHNLIKKHTVIEDIPTENTRLPSSSGYWRESTTLLGKEMTRGTRAGIIAGTVGLLGYMALKDSPKKHDENSYVAQQFYDEQYLGTQFVNFNNRNKHYMY